MYLQTLPELQHAVAGARGRVDAHLEANPALDWTGALIQRIKTAFAGANLSDESAKLLGETQLGARSAYRNGARLKALQERRAPQSYRVTFLAAFRRFATL